MHPNTIFTSQGARSSTAGCFVAIILAFGSLTMLIIGIAIPKVVGGWMVWSPVFAASLLFSWWVSKRDAVKIDLIDLKNGKISIDMKGPNFALCIPEVTAYRYWYCTEKIRAKHGGGILVKRFAVIQSSTGEQAVFKQTGGKKEEVPSHWSYDNTDPGEGKGILHVSEIERMMEILDGKYGR